MMNHRLRSILFILLLSFIHLRYSSSTSNITNVPSFLPTTSVPSTFKPTTRPSSQSSSQPSSEPSSQPSNQPTEQPSSLPTSQPTDQCNDCLVGEYYVGRSIKNGHCLGCQKCPSGYSCLGHCHSPVPCSIGQYQSSYGNSSCSDCSPGTYNLYEAQSSCLICPEGYHCADGSHEPVACAEGHYSLSGAVDCTPCQAGSYTTLQGQSTCNPCPAGFACPEASTGR